jgi:sugar lactone lactonase YvrE
MPEGIEYDSEREQFLVGSLTEGTISSISDAGTSTPFVADQALIASVGLEIDTRHQRLLVAVSDAAVFRDDTQGRALLGSYDLESGERQFMVDLGGLVPEYPHFANDVAVDDEGNAYVTDSYAPVIYKVDRLGNASVLLEDDRLLIDGFGGNGIVYHPTGSLIVGISGVSLYNIPLAYPEDLIVVETDEVISADGMIWHPDGSLIVVSGDEIVKLFSDDDWLTAEVVQRSRRHQATTVALRGEEVYAVYPRMSEPDAETCDIVRVRFS